MSQSPPSPADLMAGRPDPGGPKPPAVAVWALVLGLIAVVTGALAGIPAVVCGAVAVARVPAGMPGRGQGWAGIILGSVGILLTVLVVASL